MRGILMDGHLSREQILLNVQHRTRLSAQVLLICTGHRAGRLLHRRDPLHGPARHTVAAAIAQLQVLAALLGSQAPDPLEVAAPAVARPESKGRPSSRSNHVTPASHTT